jgi:Ring finger domain
MTDDAATWWMLVVCILAGVACLGLVQWIECKRDTAVDEFLQPSLMLSPVHHNNSWRLDGEGVSEQARRRDIENNLQVAEWLPEDSGTDEVSVDGKVAPDTNASTSTVDDALELLRDASRVVSLSSHVVSSGECAICLTTLNVHDMVCEANHVDCVHVYHAESMKAWLLRQDSCPICRSPYL